MKAIVFKRYGGADQLIKPEEIEFYHLEIEKGHTPGKIVISFKGDFE